MTDRVTLDVYDLRAGEYAQVTASEGPDETLRVFMAGLPAGGRVLDLGCGPGASAWWMAEAGLQVEAWDASEGMVKLAQAQSGVVARLASFDDLAGEPEASFDAVWANFSLLHAPRRALPRHLSQISRVLRRGGAFHIAVKEGTGERRDRLGRLYAFYSEEELRGLLVEAGFAVGAFRRGRDRGLDGGLSDWISVTAHA